MEAMDKILVIDDSLVQTGFLTSILKDDYQITVCHTAEEGLIAARQGGFSLILLDVVLPEMDGFTLLQTLKEDESTRHVPVILLTSLTDVQYEEHGLVLGAVDYITKPFDTAELLARIKVRLRENGRQCGILEYNGLSLDADMREARFGDKSVKLTKTEMAILKILMQNPNQVITKSQILDRISSDTPDCMESSLKVHVSNLRKKLRTASELDFIEAVWGIGFKMRRFD